MVQRHRLTSTAELKNPQPLNQELLQTFTLHCLRRCEEGMVQDDKPDDRSISRQASSNPVPIQTSDARFSRALITTNRGGEGSHLEAELLTGTA